MCGRFTLTSPDDVIEDLFDVALPHKLAPRYNIAPTQPVLVIRSGGRREPVREAAHLRWGLIPSWAKDPAIGNKMINARAETALEKPSFRTAMRRRRLIVVADAFYEWRKHDAGGGKSAKTPYRIFPTHAPLFAFAGLGERWQGPDGEEIESCSILTVAANDTMAPVHHRMPAILRAEEFEPWLDHSDDGPYAAKRAADLLVPWEGKPLDMHPVSRHVNSPRNDDPACVEAQEDPFL